VPSRQRRHLRRLVTLLAFLTLGTFVPLARVEAKPDFPPIVEKAYNLKPDSKLGKAAEDCTLCHTDPPKLNPYGNDIKVALETAHTKQLTPEVLHSLDAKDSDGDGANNKAEFAADTLPGDPASKPAGTVAPAPGAAGTSADTGSGGQEESSQSPLLKLLFPKHADHPLIVHFPIGLFIVAMLFDFLAVFRKDRNLALAGYYNLGIAAITSIGSVGTGLLAWWFVFAHEPFTKDNNLLFHLILGITTTVLICALWLMRFRVADKGARPGNAYLILGVIALVVIAITGHLCGNLSGVN
jgi:uncharacterized membrane protein